MKRYSNSNEPEFKRGLTEEEINSPEFDPEDFAPAPDAKQTSNENETLTNRRNALVFAFVVTFFALIIGILGWGVSTTLGGFTERAEKSEVLSLYGNCDTVTEYKFRNDYYKVYAVFFKNKMAGYCVSTTCEGFGGDIKMLVAFNSDNMITNIRIAEHNESRGLGSKIAGSEFLSQFKGLLVGNSAMEYDLIAGATASSKSVGEAVRAILGLGLSTDSIASELGYDTITEEEIEEEVGKEEKDPADTTNAKDPAETTGNKKPPVNEFQGGSNSNQDSGDMNMDGKDETTVYETETKKPDEDETTEAETTEKKEEETTGNKEEETTGPEDTKTEETTGPSDTTGEAETTAPDVSETTAPDSTTADTTAPPAPETTKPGFFN